MLLLVVACGPKPTTTRPPSPAPEPAAPSGPDVRLPEGVLESAVQIDPEALERDIAALSGDAFEGRGPGTEGDVAARAWLAEQLGALGYEPGMSDGRWEQPFEIVGITAAVPETWTFRAGKRKRAFRWWDEFIAASGVQQPRVEVKNAEVVFVGHGIVAPEEQWDDYGETDLRGKVLLMLNDEPPSAFAGERRLYYGRWTYKYESAAARGAAGAIIIHTDASAGYPWSVVQSSWNGEQVELPAADEPRTPILGWLTEAAAAELVAMSGQDLDALVTAADSREFEPVPLGVKTSLAFDVALRRTQTANVVAKRPGSDPALADQAVVFSAHHDHLGKGKPNAAGDAIYNGARDNASGVAQALGVARAFARLPRAPRRSLLFVFVGAEEQGLLGSKYFAQHPSLPAANMAANINFELGNIWGATENIVIHGKGKSDLDRTIEAVATWQGRRVEDEADPGSGWFYRSDQLSFARVGVPAAWFESGRDFVGKPEGWGDEVVPKWITEHYHQPTDELTDAWNFEGLTQDTALAFIVGAAVAEADEAPKWVPTDEFAPLRE